MVADVVTPDGIYVALFGHAFALVGAAVAVLTAQPASAPDRHQ